MNRWKNRIRNTFGALFEEITVFEYLLWWVARVMMLVVVIFCVPSERVMCFLNMLALYAVSAIRFVAPKNSLLGQLSFRCQHIVNVIEIIGTFFGNFLNAYAHVFKYDRILHFLSGPLAVLAGYYVVKAIVSTPTQPKTPSATLASAFSFCFSFLIICMWEITEFVGDYLFGTQNQSFYYAPFDDDIWFKIFGHGALGGEGQFPLWDTMMDMIDATLATIVSAVVLYAVLRLLEKHKDKTALAEKGAESE